MNNDPINHVLLHSGPQITFSEGKHGINLAKNGKAADTNDIPAEFFKIMNSDCIKTLTAIFNKIYDTGIIKIKNGLGTCETLFAIQVLIQREVNRCICVFLRLHKSFRQNGKMVKT